MEKYKKIITELETFRQDVKFYFANTYATHGKDTTQTRENIAKQTQKIKRYLNDANIITSVTGHAAPVAGGFPFQYDLIEDIFSNEHTPYAVQPNLVLDTLNKAIGVYEERVESGALISNVGGTTTSNTREGFFVDGQYYDAQKFVRELFRRSKKSIKIIDNYIDENVIDLLTGKPPETFVEILTREIAKNVEPVGKAFTKQHGKLTIRLSDAFHDRFIIIDDDTFYHLGASIKDLGKRTFMYSLIEEETMINLLKEKLKLEWGKAKIVL